MTPEDRQIRLRQINELISRHFHGLEIELLPEESDTVNYLVMQCESAEAEQRCLADKPGLERAFLLYKIRKGMRHYSDRTVFDMIVQALKDNNLLRPSPMPPDLKPVPHLIPVPIESERSPSGVP